VAGDPAPLILFLQFQRSSEEGEEGILFSLAVAYDFFREA